MSKVISIDPGLEGTGVALWTYEGSTTDWKRIELPYSVWTYTPRGPTWVDRAQDCWRWLDYIYRVHEVVDTYCEWPKYFDGPVGHTATVRGDIHKLVFLIGGIARMQTHTYTGSFHLVPVNEWKGQLPKQVVIDRINACYKRERLSTSGIHITSHGWDAVGIGLHAKGFSFG